MRYEVWGYTPSSHPPSSWLLTQLLMSVYMMTLPWLLRGGGVGSEGQIHCFLLLTPHEFSFCSSLDELSLPFLDWCRERWHCLHNFSFLPLASTPHPPWLDTCEGVGKWASTRNVFVQSAPESAMTWWPTTQSRNNTLFSLQVSMALRVDQAAVLDGNLNKSLFQEVAKAS